MPSSQCNCNCRSGSDSNSGCGFWLLALLLFLTCNRLDRLERDIKNTKQTPPGTEARSVEGKPEAPAPLGD